MKVKSIFILQGIKSNIIYKALNRISFVETAILPLHTLVFLSLLAAFSFLRKKMTNKKSIIGKIKSYRNHFDKNKEFLKFILDLLKMILLIISILINLINK